MDTSCGRWPLTWLKAAQDGGGEAATPASLRRARWLQYSIPGSAPQGAHCVKARRMGVYLSGSWWRASAPAGAHEEGLRRDENGHAHGRAAATGAVRGGRGGPGGEPGERRGVLPPSAG